MHCKSLWIKAYAKCINVNLPKCWSGLPLRKYPRIYLISTHSKMSMRNQVSNWVNVTLAFLKWSVMIWIVLTGDESLTDIFPDI